MDKLEALAQVIADLMNNRNKLIDELESKKSSLDYCYKRIGELEKELLTEKERVKQLREQAKNE